MFHAIENFHTEDCVLYVSAGVFLDTTLRPRSLETSTNASPPHQEWPFFFSIDPLKQAVHRSVLFTHDKRWRSQAKRRCLTSPRRRGPNPTAAIMPSLSRNSANGSGPAK